MYHFRVQSGFARNLFAVCCQFQFNALKIQGCGDGASCPLLMFVLILQMRPAALAGLPIIVLLNTVNSGCLEVMVCG